MQTQRLYALVAAAIPTTALIWWLLSKRNKQKSNSQPTTEDQSALDKEYLLFSNEYLLDIYKANSDRPFSCSKIVTNKGAKSQGHVGEILLLDDTHVAVFVDQSEQQKNSVLEVWDIKSDSLTSTIELVPFVTKDTLRFMANAGNNFVMLWCNKGTNDRVITVDWQKRRLRYDVLMTAPRPHCKYVNQIVIFGRNEKYCMIGVDSEVCVLPLPITSNTKPKDALKTFSICDPNAILDQPRTIEPLPNGRFAVNSEQGIKIIEFSTSNVERTIKMTPNPTYLRVLSTNVMVARRERNGFDIWDIDEERLIKQVESVEIPVLERVGHNLLLHGSNGHLDVFDVENGIDVVLDTTGENVTERSAVFVKDRLIVRAQDATTKQPLLKIWSNE
jgi:hypothetical protein